MFFVVVRPNFPIIKRTISLTPMYQHTAKPPVSCKLFAEKEASPKTKQGRSSEQPAAESTKAWVVKSFAEKLRILIRKQSVETPKELKKSIQRRVTLKLLLGIVIPAWRLRKRHQIQGKPHPGNRSLMTNAPRNLRRKVRKHRLLAVRL